MDNLHFLRPAWLLLLVLLPLLPALIRQLSGGQHGWARVIPPALLRPLVAETGEGNRQAPKPARPWQRSAALVPALTLILVSVSLAGPAWREAPTPLQQQSNSLVVVLDLSLSMLATDVDPDRLTLAKRKIRDLLQEREGAFTALVVYAADAHIVTPLSDDRQTIEGLLEVLDPTIMPEPGNRPERGIALARTLLQQGARGEGQILLISDGIREDQHSAISEALARQYPLNTLTVGTPEGGPIPLPKRGYIRENDDIVITRANAESLRKLASANAGGHQELTLDNTDLRRLALRAEDSDDWQDSERALSIPRWQDDGYWLLLLVVPLALLCWRRGMLLILPLALLPLLPQPAQALEWDDLWSRPDQRGAALIEEDPQSAAGRFEDPEWIGSARYRAEEYEEAAEAFARSDHPQADYNRANALARAGRLQSALEAYDEALARDPDHTDARHNRELVKQLLDQQEKQQEQQQGEDGEQNQESRQNQDSQSGQGNQNQQGEPQDAGEDQSGNQGQPGEQGENSAGEPEDRDTENETQDNEAREQEDDSAGQQAENSETDSDAGQQPRETDARPLSQGQEQWLRRIPDDPGGLLRRKFLQQYQNRNTPTDENDTPW